MVTFASQVSHHKNDSVRVCQSACGISRRIGCIGFPGVSAVLLLEDVSN